MNKEDLERKINALDRFPGSLEEYSELKRMDYVIIDTQRQEKFVRLNDRELLSELIKDGCVALIRYNTNPVPTTTSQNYDLHEIWKTKSKESPYGIPVKIFGKD